METEDNEMAAKLCSEWLKN